MSEHGPAIRRPTGAARDRVPAARTAPADAPRDGWLSGPLADPDPRDMPVPDPADWRMLLRSERLRLGLSQVALAQLVRVSPETIRKYEAGGRTPARATLERLVHALQLPATKGRALLAAAGFTAPETLFPAAAYPGYYYTLAELRAEVERVPWPEFVTDDLAEIVAANRAAQALWGVDFAAELARRSRSQINLLAVAAERHFAARVANWSECLAVLAGIFKGRPREPISLENPGAFFSEVLEAYVTNDPGAIPQLLAAWESTPPQPAKVRWAYRLVWREPDVGDIEFRSLVSVASEPDGLWFNDWVPVDAEGHARLGAVLARRHTGGRRSSQARDE